MWDTLYCIELTYFIIAALRNCLEALKFLLSCDVLFICTLILNNPIHPGVQTTYFCFLSILVCINIKVDVDRHYVNGQADRNIDFLRQTNIKSTTKAPSIKQDSKEDKQKDKQTLPRYVLFCFYLRLPLRPRFLNCQIAGRAPPIVNRHSQTRDIIIRFPDIACFLSSAVPRDWFFWQTVRK